MLSSRAGGDSQVLCNREEEGSSVLLANRGKEDPMFRHTRGIVLPAPLNAIPCKHTENEGLRGVGTLAGQHKYA